MKIWFAASVSPHSCGGVKRSMESLAGGLSTRNHQTVCVYSEKGSDNFLGFMARLALKLFVSKDRPDWIVARSTDGFLCALACRLFNLRVKTVLHNHGWEEKVFEIERRLPMQLIPHPTTWRAKMVRFPLLRLTLSLSTLCLCGTIEEARWIGRKYPRCVKKLCVVPNGIDVRESCHWSRTDRTDNFLVVGGFTWKKNVEYGLSVFGALREGNPRARLYIVGTGPVDESMRGKTAPFGESVQMIEQEKPQRMEGWYRRCPFLISSSRYEGGRSFAILEALSFGVVVFATDIPSTREIISSGKNGILLSGCEVSGDAARVAQTVHDTDLCARISMNAWRFSTRNGAQRQAGRLERALRRGGGS